MGTKQWVARSVCKARTVWHVSSSNDNYICTEYVRVLTHYYAVHDDCDHYTIIYCYYIVILLLVLLV